VKLVIAIIKPFKLEEVQEALGGLGIQGMTVTEVKGYGRQKGQTEIYRGAEYQTNMVPKVKLEIAAPDALAPRIIETIQQAAHTGAIGDGKIFALDLGSAVRIRTGETDDMALCPGRTQWCERGTRCGEQGWRRRQAACSGLGICFCWGFCWRSWRLPGRRRRRRPSRPSRCRRW
jgi:nitrogen regulatory protein P-II 2